MKLDGSCSGPCVLLFLKSGMTFEHFQSVGNMPVFIDLLKIAHNDSAIKSGQTRSSLADILSKPVALDLHSLDKRENTRMYWSLEIENCARDFELLDNQDASDQSH